MPMHNYPDGRVRFFVSTRARAAEVHWAAPLLRRATPSHAATASRLRAERAGPPAHRPWRRGGSCPSPSPCGPPRLQSVLSASASPSCPSSSNESRPVCTPRREGGSQGNKMQRWDRPPWRIVACLLPAQVLVHSKGTRTEAMDHQEESWPGQCAQPQGRRSRTRTVVGRGSQPWGRSAGPLERQASLERLRAGTCGARRRGLAILGPKKGTDEGHYLLACGPFSSLLLALPLLVLVLVLLWEVEDK